MQYHGVELVEVDKNTWGNSKLIRNMLVWNKPTDVPKVIKVIGFNQNNPAFPVKTIMGVNYAHCAEIPIINPGKDLSIEGTITIPEDLEVSGFIKNLMDYFTCIGVKFTGTIDGD